MASDGPHRPWQPEGYALLARIDGAAQVDGREVWRAREAASGDEVALKRISREHSAPLREAAVLERFVHPHVIRLRAVILSSTDLVFVLDYAAGGDLYDRVTHTGPLPARDVAEMLVALADALHVAHEKGIVHHDLSPTNVLFTRDGAPLLADLGLARIVGRRSAHIEGTDGYIAPELFVNQSYTRASDVYGLAAVAAFALAGREVDSLDLPEWTEYVQSLGAPLALVEAIIDALAPDPVQRSSAAELRDAAKECLASAAFTNVDSVEVSAAEPSESYERPTTRHVIHPPASEGVGFPASENGHVVGDSSSTPSSALSLRVGDAIRPLIARVRRIPTKVLYFTAVACASVALVVAIVFVWDVTGSDTAPESPRAGGTSTSEREDVSIADTASAVAGQIDIATWQGMLEELDARRGEAFEKVDASRLEGVYVADSPPMRADARHIATLVQHNRSARGVRHDVEVVAVTPRGDGEAVVEIRDTLRAYSIVDSRGRSVEDVPAGESKRLAMTLRHTNAGWRIADITDHL